MSSTNERDIDIEQESASRVRITTSPHHDAVNTDFPSGEQVANVIPIVEENFTISKKDIEKEVHLEQRWVSTTKKVEVPIRYQQFYINGKELESYEGMGSIGEIFSKIKDKIKDAISDDEHGSSSKADHFIIKYHKEDEIAQEKYHTSGEMVSLQTTGQFDGSSSLGSGAMTNTLSSETEKERIIPIWAEEVVISKRMVKVGEVVVRKNRVTENQKVDVDVVREKLTIKYPDGKKEEINA